MTHCAFYTPPARGASCQPDVTDEILRRYHCHDPLVGVLMLLRSKIADDELTRRIDDVLRDSGDMQ